MCSSDLFSYPHPVSVQFVRPDGTSLGTARKVGASTTFLDPIRLDASGTWRVVVSAPDPDAGAMRVLLRSVTDQNATLTVGGAGVLFVFNQPGQVARVSFTRTAGQPFVLHFVGSTLVNTPVRVYPPGTASFLSCTVGAGNLTCPMHTASTTGTYVAIIDPPGENLGLTFVSVGTV